MKDIIKKQLWEERFLAAHQQNIMKDQHLKMTNYLVLNKHTEITQIIRKTLPPGLSPDYSSMTPQPQECIWTVILLIF
ncbi:MAG: hypothetical protein KKD73_12670 [Proteobacteria bacterium]|nr:hypothetical protein [Pseudomonadota bacterium]MBU1640899.1 hypothetical protein [Pseudomonadota bacterium]